VDVMFWREKFCTKTCPYGMLQAVFTDSKTQIVRYATERHDECIECKACVRDCPMGIDIRESPYQTECTHCGDCVDSCTKILARLKTPLPTLIAFSWGEQNVPRIRWYQRLGFVDAKRWGVLALTVVYACVLVFLIQARTPLSLSASGDRSTLYHLTDDGRVYNDYALKISNRSLSDDVFMVTCSRAEVEPSHGCNVTLEKNPFPLASREVRTTKMRLYIPMHRLQPGPNRLLLTATSIQHPEMHATTDIVFFMPEPDISGSGSSSKALQ
jgi:polyferredoxin